MCTLAVYNLGGIEIENHLISLLGHDGETECVSVWGGRGDSVTIILYPANLNRTKTKIMVSLIEQLSFTY